MPRIAGAGICCQDYIVVAPRAPWGGQSDVADYYVQGGGLVATALVACARLGAKCDFFSILGSDDVGDDIVAGLIEEKIPAADIVRVEGGGSPFSFIHTDVHSGERTIFHRRARGFKWTEGMHDFGGIRECDALLVDDVYPELAIRSASIARADGIPVVADMSPKESNLSILQQVDILIAPHHFAQSIGCEDELGKALDAIHRLGPSTAIITLGADGWVYSDSSGTGRGKGFQVDVVDTNGAGDTFHGAFTYGVGLGWDTPTCAEFAAAVAAIKCTGRGGRSALPSLMETLEFLESRGSVIPGRLKESFQSV